MARALPLHREPAVAAAATVVVDRACNQRCGFCDGRADRDGPEHADAAVRAAIDAALAGGARAVVLTGGEPALRAELPAWIARAAAGGVRVAVETNGTIFAYRARARAVAAAGLAEARLALPAGDDDAAAAITRDPGGLGRALGGLAELTAAGVDVLVTIPLTDAALPSLPSLVERAAAAVAAPGRLLGFQAHLLRATPLSVGAAASAVAAAASAAAALHLPFRMAPDAALPPCAFPEAGTGAETRTGTALLEGMRGGRRAACADCALDGICPGPPPPVPDAALAPLSPAGAARRAPLLGDRARAAVLDAASLFHYLDDDLGAVVPGATVRLTYGCNQRCPMCFVDTSLGPVPAPLWRPAIEDAAARGVRYLQISGGEPTLSPDVAAAVALARARGIGRIELQTNALRCADPAYARALAAAGLTHALVSLHGATDAVADAVTLAPGTAARTAAGIDALLAAGVAVQIHFVMNGVNHAEAPAFVERVLARWGTRPSLLFSFVAPMDRVPKERWLVPRLSEAAPSLRAALDRCLAAGLRFTGPGSFCGVPLCVLDGDPRYYPDRHPVPEGSVAGEFVRAAACDGCRERPACRGLRRAYADLYGTGELRRISGPTR